ncbi:MAG: GNAT family N-acetyltransferase [Anaerolineae bacterium]
MTLIVQVEPHEIAAIRDDIMRVYHAAFAAPPYNEGEAEADRAAQSLVQHARRDGFRLLVAREDSGQIVGFSYGYRGQPGQWWHDLVSKLLSHEARARWLGDCFEFVELAVLPTFQGRGIGGRLHDAILAGLPYRTAVLSTYSGEDRAHQLYRNRGWQTLVAELIFPGSPIPMIVYGLELQA